MTTPTAADRQVARDIILALNPNHPDANKVMRILAEYRAQILRDAREGR